MSLKFNTFIFTVSLFACSFSAQVHADSAQAVNEGAQNFMAVDNIQGGIVEPILDDPTIVRAMPLTLKQAVLNGLSVPGNVTKAYAQMGAAKSEQDQVKASFYPELDFSIGAGGRDTGGADLNRKANDPGNGMSLRTGSSGLTLGYDLLDFGERRAKFESAEKQHLASAKTFDATVHQTASDVIDAYFRVARQREVVQRTMWTFEKHRQIAMMMRNAFWRGWELQSNYQAALSRLSETKMLLREQRLELVQEVQDFYRLVGVYPGRQIIQDKISLPAHSGDELVNLALEWSPEIEAAQANVLAQQKMAESIESGNWGKISLAASAYAGENLNYVEDQFSDVRSTVNYKVQLFDGGRRKAEEREALYNARQSMSDLEAVQRTVEKRVRADFLTYSEALAAENESILDLITEMKLIDLYHQEFMLGRRGFNDLLDSVDRVRDAWSRQITSRYTLLEARYNLLKETGYLFHYLDIPPETIMSGFTDKETSHGSNDKG